MKKYVSLFCLIYLLTFLNVNAQNYLISFTGTGASTTIATVKVENLTKNTILTLSGGDILLLTGTTGVNSPEDSKSSELKIYPNPMINKTTLEIFPPVAGNAVISISDMTGIQLTQIQSYLENQKQSFGISGIKNGFYLVTVIGNNYQLSGKLISNGNPNGTIDIEKVNNINQTANGKAEKTVSKGTMATIDMQYSTGDRLKFTGISGNYSTVKIDIPTSGKTVTFNFIACADGDNNNYPVVEIGSQVWMAENLKTSKFSDGSAIPLVTDNAVWGTLTTPGHRWYNNDQALKAIYGVLYNWYALDAVVNGNKNVCPAGWHVPGDTEWTALSAYLGGGSVTGGKLKETGTTHWSSPNTGATNESGFSALPGGICGYNGLFSYIGSSSYWWSVSQLNATTSLSRYIDYNGGNVYGTASVKYAGFSVRCIKDN